MQNKYSYNSLHVDAYCNISVTSIYFNYSDFPFCFCFSFFHSRSNLDFYILSLISPPLWSIYIEVPTVSADLISPHFTVFRMLKDMDPTTNKRNSKHKMCKPDVLPTEIRLRMILSHLAKKWLYSFFESSNLTFWKNTYSFFICRLDMKLQPAASKLTLA